MRPICPVRSSRSNRAPGISSLYARPYDGFTIITLGWFENKDRAGTQWQEHWDPNVFLGVDGTYQTAVRNAVRDRACIGENTVIEFRIRIGPAEARASKKFPD